MLRIAVSSLAAWLCALLWLVPGALGGPAYRSWTVSATPAPRDFSLLQIGFAGAGARLLTARLLRVSALEPYGSDYVAVAAVRPGTSRRARVLVLVVNRPSALLDPSRVRLRLRALRSLGAATLRGDQNALASTSTRSRAVCDLHLAEGTALTAGRLAPSGTQGTPLAGFSTAGAVAQAYDATCGLPTAAKFVEDVRGGDSWCPSGADPCPPPPGPPTPEPGPPGCKPCVPDPGIACPLMQRTVVCDPERHAGGHT